MVQLALRTAEFFAPRVAAASARPAARAPPGSCPRCARIEEGIAHPEEVDLLLSICDKIEGKCLCPLGDACAMPVRAVVKGFREEFDQHVRPGRLPVPRDVAACRSLYPQPRSRCRSCRPMAGCAP